MDKEGIIEPGNIVGQGSDFDRLARKGLSHNERILDDILQTKVFGVSYKHLCLENGDELYITRYGLPFIRNLLPDSFYTDESWYRNHSQSLSGTSSLYRVQTKPVEGRSLDIVLKWNRMGQDIPGLLEAEEFINEEFNSPFEEFALLTELRDSSFDPKSEDQVLTQKPLAIYIPAGFVELDRLGRKTYKMKHLMSTHGDVELNMNRSYAVIYGWIKGIDAVQAVKQDLLREEDLEGLTLRSREIMRRRGYYVADSKPHHLIVRAAKDDLVRDRKGQLLFAYVDFELLKRTPEREEERRASKRRIYLQKQAHRFDTGEKHVFPPNLEPVKIMGVDYVYGAVEGQRGALWVVGRDPNLFDYFLPEQWHETHRVRLSVSDQVFKTTTTSNVHLVWKISRVGEIPDLDPFSESERKIIDHGFNSPFEEVALALELQRKGVRATYPRAIYMASGKSEIDESMRDHRRYESHQTLLNSFGEPVLKENRDYIIFWGFWNGPDELLAEKDESLCQGIDVLSAYRRGLLDKNMYEDLLQRKRNKLLSVGIEDLNLKGNHILVSLHRDGYLITDNSGIPETRLFNFELLRRLDQAER